MSDDGRHGLSLIAFIGSVFSPYYAWARRRGAADPRDHCAVNIALYGPGRKRWAMTERGCGSLRQETGLLAIGKSALCWDGTTLTIDLDEVTVPWPSRIRGQIRLHPAALTQYRTALDAEGLHRWRPLAPRAHVEVNLQSPSLRWYGPGYFDSNRGAAPMENSLLRWDWSRASLRDGTAVLYDVTPRSGEELSLALHFDRHGEVTDFIPPPTFRLPNSGWGIRRAARGESGGARILRTVEDTPFYARTLLSSRLIGQQVTSVHESLNLDRFRSPWVQAMLPFRMPRGVW